MTNKDIDDIRIRYNDLIRIKQDLLNTKQKIQELEQEPIVREYLDLIEQQEHDKLYPYYSVLELSDEDIFQKVIDEVLIHSIGSIYVYFGDYRCVESEDDGIQFIPISKSNEQVEYKQYKNIEHNLSIVHMIPLNDCEEFENKNIILVPSKLENKIEYFNRMRTMYFNVAMKYGKEKALEKVMYKRNMQKNSRI